MLKKHAAVAIAVTVLLSAPLTASAQPATTFEALSTQNRLEAGDTLRVTDVAGNRVTGRLVSISPASLTLLLGPNDQQTVAADLVQRIQRDDRPWDGLLIGLGVGMGVALVANRTLCGGNDEECETIVNLAIGAPAIVSGAALGALIDTLHRTTVYRRPAGGRVTWIVTPRFLGARVNLR